MLLKRVFGYAMLPLLSTLTPFLVLPVISRAASTPEWSALAVGQSIGLLASLVVSYGWLVVGPPRLPHLDTAERQTLYAQSLRTRLTVLAFLTPVVALLAWAVAPGALSARWLCVLMALAQTSAGMSIAWYCIGTGAPGKIARFEVFPRAAGAVIAAALVLVTHWLWLYPLALMVSLLIGVTHFSREVLSGYKGGARVEPHPLRHLFERQAVPTLIEVSAGSYTMGGGFLANFVTSDRQMAVFGSADRLSQLALQSIAAVGNALSPWVAESHGRAFVRRAQFALAIHAVLGVAGGACIAALGPWASELLFGPRHDIDQSTAVGFGAYFLAVSLQTVLARHILVSRGRVRIVLVATLCGAAVGVPAVLAGGHLRGASGAASGLALGEMVICLALAWPAFATMRRHASEPVTALVRQKLTSND